jgi:hypothetical protein
MSRYSVYQHWDPLRVCIVGRSYPPEFYSWITNLKVRNLFERIAIETEEDYDAIIKKLNEFSVQVFRPKLCENAYIQGRYLPPPMTPRDHMVMIGDRFYKGYQLDFAKFYDQVRDPAWPECTSLDQFAQLPKSIQTECNEVHNLDKYLRFYASYDHIFEHVEQQGNVVRSGLGNFTNGAFVSRIGRDLYFGTEIYGGKTEQYQTLLDLEFTNTRNHIIDTGGHSDSTYCPVCPGLIISLNDVPTYADTFPGWEVVYLPGQSWNKVKPFLDLKRKNKGRWWIPGFEYDDAVVDTVETWLSHWVGYVEETVFDINMLIIDPKNVMVFNENKLVFEAFRRYGITPHVVPFRHRYFWDGGIHCVTSDLCRDGSMQDYFPQRCQIT